MNITTGQLLDWLGRMAFSLVNIGRDEKSTERGTWFGMNKMAQIGIIMSITESMVIKNAPSRGKIVSDFLKSRMPPKKFCDKFAAISTQFNGFHLLTIQKEQDEIHITTLTNRFMDSVEPVLLAPGLYGFGNGPRNMPFKKVIHGEKLFSEFLTHFDFHSSSEDELIEGLLKISKDTRECYPDEQIHRQINRDNYKFLCSLFVKCAERRYGTRTHSILLIKKNDWATFYQTTMVDIDITTNVEDAKWETTIEKFKINDDLL